MFASPLDVPLARSQRAAFALTSGHTVAGVAAAASLPIVWTLPLLLALALSLWHALRHYAWRSAPGAISRLNLSSDGGLTLTRRDGRTVSGSLPAGGFVSCPLIVLHLPGARRWRAIAVVIPADAVDPDQHRRLRVWLNWRLPAAGPGQSGRRADNQGVG